jgi:mannose-1-phosphate guanylyltransferase
MIMAGGAGTRLWPMSRLDKPKQLIPLLDGKSLLQTADERLTRLIEPEHRYVCTAEQYRSRIAADLPHYSDDQILGEPAMRDTVNAIGLCAAVLVRRDPDAVLAVLTADHVIRPEEQFLAALRTAYRLVEDDPSRLVTFAIRPSHPATGYGYVERGAAIEGFQNAHVALRFVEKPNLAAARQYLAAGTFGWNSGMFVWSAATFLDYLKRFKPESHAGVTRIAEVWDTPKRQETLETVYPTLPKISVDYAMMEPASQDPDIEICAVDMDVQWLDIGSWPTFAEALEADGHGNRMSAAGPVELMDSFDCLIVSDDPNHMVAVVGADDLIVIHTDDATLVCSKDHAQRVRDLRDQVDQRLH